MNTYFGGRYDRDAILRDLGKEFLGSGTLYKRWPCVGTAHSHMKAAIDIVTPATLADAKFSLPFLVSIAIVRRGMSVSDFSEAGLNDAEVLGIGSRISLIRDPALDWKLELPPGRVEIVARDGRRWLEEGRNVPGNADNPLGWTDICAKFRECGSVAVTPVPNKVLARAEDLARTLETLGDATELIIRFPCE
jgi:2-methylcitrate dehydratase PrpD